jgi:serine/threonine-protein kinase
MGVVYRGKSLSTERAVAVKLMHQSLPGEMAARARFEREAKLMALVDHPHCVSVIDYGLHEGKPYLVMELVRGRSLHDVIGEQRYVELARAADIIRQVLSGLAYAHEQDIIHRDIKPANIMVTPKAPLGVHVRILDFGLARLREASTSLTDGLAVGTPSYMAPEQCRGDKLDARVDLYACGVVLFEMLSGKKPFVAKDPIEIVKLQLQAPVPSLGGPLAAVVTRALAKKPEDRFESAIAMSEAIDAALAGGVAAEPTATLLGSSSLMPPSIEVPITVGSSVVEKKKPRARYLALPGLLVVAAVIYAVVGRGDEEPKPVAVVPRDAAAVVVVPPDAAPLDPAATIISQAEELAAGGKPDAAIDALVKARRVYPDRANLAYAAGKLYFAKMWFTDGIKSFRDAIKLEPSLRNDPELVKAVVRGFIMTPDYDERLGAFLLELGDAAQQALDETARSHPNPQVRARATAQLRRTKR